MFNSIQYIFHILFHCMTLYIANIYESQMMTTYKHKIGHRFSRSVMFSLYQNIYKCTKHKHENSALLTINNGEFRPHKRREHA